MDQEQIRKSVAAFIRRGSRSNSIDNDTDIFASGYVNSLFALEIIVFIEREFSVAVVDEDLELANFRSISAISAMVERKAAMAI